MALKKHLEEFIKLFAENSREIRERQELHGRKHHLHKASLDENCSLVLCHLDTASHLGNWNLHEKIPVSDWPTGKPGGYFLDY